jgi:hypothetical protein
MAHMCRNISPNLQSMGTKFASCGRKIAYISTDPQNRMQHYTVSVVTVVVAPVIYRVSIKSLPDFINLLNKNYARYKHTVFLQRLPQLKKFFALH